MTRIFNFDTEKQWDYENGYYLTSHPTRLAKSIVHWELYQKSLNLPGDIVECGVFKGASLIRFATYREMCESTYSRKIVGFDTFGEFPLSGDTNDREFIRRWAVETGSGITLSELEQCLDYKSFSNIELVKGDLLKTLPEYIKRNPQFRISLLHIDVDVYEPTKVIFEQLYPLVVCGGIIIFDDYGTVAGETQAVEEYFEINNIPLELRKTPFYKVPSYIIKK